MLLGERLRARTLRRPRVAPGRPTNSAPGPGVARIDRRPLRAAGTAPGLRDQASRRPPRATCSGVQCFIAGPAARAAPQDLTRHGHVVESGSCGRRRTPDPARAPCRRSRRCRPGRRPPIASAIAARRSTSCATSVPAPSRISAMIASGSSERGLSDVTITRSASRRAIAPISGRLPRSRSPPQPNTTCTRLVGELRAPPRARSQASPACARSRPAPRTPGPRRRSRTFPDLARGLDRPRGRSRRARQRVAPRRARRARCRR